MGSGLRGGGPGFGSSVCEGGDAFSSFFGDDIFSVLGDSQSMNSAPKKAPPIERKLPCSLEELYKGTTKRMRISREIANGRRMTTEEEILTIDIKRGWKKGTKITFPEKGNKLPNVTPSDVVIIIDEKPHSVFTRDGNDLIATQKISLVEALTTSDSVHLKTLDGRNLAIPISNVVHPSYEEVVQGEGMPIPRDPTRRGNLRIKFDIKFPTRVTAEQKYLIKNCFPHEI